MRRRCRKIPCQLIFVVSYISLVSLIVRLIIRQPCPDGKQETASVLTKSTSAVHHYDEGESWKVKVRIDWRKYSPEQHSINQSGVAVNGVRVVKTSVIGHTNKPCHRHAVRYNHCASDRIPVVRTIKDTRPESCLNMRYLRALPRVSVVITLSWTPMSVLLRALHSLQRTTPDILLSEIILVHLPSSTETDDSMRQTEKSINSEFPNVVFLRCESILGVRGARLLGVHHASGDVIVFLQVPFEVNVNWLPPLLEPIVEDKEGVTCPVTDILDPETFEYTAWNTFLRGDRKTFNWHFEPVTFMRSRADRSQQHLPYTTPVLELKAFAVYKSRFLELSKDHSGLHTLGGGEDIELSLKTWLCGGKVLIVPCSRIGVFTEGQQKTFNSYDVKNFRLLVRNWFDEYDKFVLSQIGYGEEALEVNSQTQRLKERLICKPFRWFLEKVSPELVERFPPYIPSVGLGLIQSERCRTCLSVVRKTGESLVPLHTCSDPLNNLNDHAHLMKDGHIRVLGGKMCVSLTQYGVPMYEPCSSVRLDQIWTYNATSQVLMNSMTERCLRVLLTCDSAYFPKCERIKMPSDKWWIVNDVNKVKPPRSTTTGRPTTTVKIRKLD